MVDKMECPHCKEELDLDSIDDESFFGANESRGECWGAPCSEYVVYGFHCPNCGAKVEF